MNLHSAKPRFQRPILVFAAALGVAMAANGVFVLIAPALWYTEVPGVARTGLFNQHFIRDIGLLYVAIGAAFIAGNLSVVHRVLLWASATAWLTAHALFHFWEVAAGICGPEVLWVDFRRSRCRRLSVFC
ncbi:hypothetical protein [Pseudomonas fluorescens]|uniref:Uncharacterized protein n=1 Tax=Pseudomonas fluorescens TaxID=294 RepID=A0A5E7F7K0_PSEFL|nr:hypothetical protein [Pseudomonas fluorescens]VVO35451.1 hypothetical protein PS691_05282 [Pseudomonas fluorescens]